MKYTLNGQKNEYDGEFLNNKFHGQGKLSTAKAVHEGQWDSGQLIENKSKTIPTEENKDDSLSMSPQQFD